MTIDTDIYVPPPDDEFPERIAAVIEALIRDGIAAGAEALRPIAYARRDIERRRSLPRSVLGTVFRRDSFTCRYCGGRLIPTPIMVLLSSVYPDEFPFHPNRKGGLTHPAILSRRPIVDHVIPGSRGGDWRSIENMVTACWPCNSRKGDLPLARLGWRRRPIADDGWDGLTGHYAMLFQVAGEPKAAYHRAWMTALQAVLP